jgi:photosystem II stability/assembly factor-like uncharacterized protein
MFRIAMRALPLLLLLAAGNVWAHDPSAYGGAFRSRNLGGTWLNADVGLFLNAALTVAVDPRRPSHLLIGTDLGILSSGNAGRSWVPEAQDLIVGAVFAIAFAADGETAMCAAPSGTFRFQDGRWTQASAPDDATPARAIAIGVPADRVYLAGRSGLFRSEDGGDSYSRVVSNLPDEAEITALAVAREPHEILIAVVGDRVMSSDDGGRRWQEHSLGPGAGRVDTVVLDPTSPNRVWAASTDRLYVSEDLGLSWRPVGRELPEPQTNVRGIAADKAATTLVVTTHRGMYRSEDGGQTWALKEDNLPVHLESGPISRDPSDPRILYSVYSLIPYAEVWRTAVEGGNLLGHADPIGLLGGGAFVVLLLICGALLVRRLARLRAGASGPRHSLP